MSEHQKDAVTAARDLTATLSELSDRLDRVTAREEKTRRLTWRSIIAVGIDIILSVLLVVVYAQSRDNSATLSQLHAASATYCRSANQTRAQEILLWEHIYDLSGINSHTPAKQRKADNELITYVKHVFAPKNCAALFQAP